MLQSYSGDTDAKYFRGHCELVARHNSWTEEELRDQRLTGKAVDLVTLYYPEGDWNVEQLWELFEPKFKKPQLDKTQAEHKLQGMRYAKGQSLEDLEIEIVRLMAREGPTKPTESVQAREEGAVNQLLKMMPEKVRLWVAGQNPTSLEQT
jgi:hypothetical protein